MPGGIWTEADTKSARTQPGVYSNIMAEAARIIEPGAGGVVFIVGKADWGPLDTVVEVRSARPSSLGDSIQERFGLTDSLFKLGDQAFQGGALAVRCLRISTAAAAKATVTLQDGDNSPADALVLTAKYEGTRANSFAVTVKDHPVSGKILEIAESGVLLESFFVDTNTNEAVAAQLNATSSYVDAKTTGTTGRALGDVSNAALTGGDSGKSLVAADYTAAQNIAVNEAFDVYVQDDDTTSANQDSAASWAKAQRAAGHRFVAVFGGTATETAANARTRAKAMNDESNVYVHPGFVDGSGVTFSGQEAAARIAGLIAGKGFTRAVTYSPLPRVARTNLTLSPSAVGLHLEAGVLPLVADGGSIRVSSGINTLTSHGTGTNKLATFAKIRTIRTLDAVQNGIERGSRAYLGEVTNDEDGRKSLEGALSDFLDELVSGGAIQDEYSLSVDRGEADQVFISIGLTPLDSIEQVFTTIFVSA